MPFVDTISINEGFRIELLSKEINDKNISSNLFWETLTGEPFITSFIPK